METMSHQLSSPIPGGADGRRALWVRTVLWLAVTCIVLDWGIVRAWMTHGVDFPKHWLAARALLAGANVYTGWELYLGFNYPQWMAFAHFFLGLTDLRTAEHLYDLNNLAFALLCWWIGVRQYRPDGSLAPTAWRAELARHWGLLLALTLAMYQPLTTCMPAGNIDPYNAFFSLLTVGLMFRRRPVAAGVAWMLLVLCKLLPLAMLVVFVLWRCRRLMAGAGATLAAYLLLLVLTGRVGYEWFFYHQIVPEIGYYWRGISMSLPRGLMMLLGLDDRAGDRTFYSVFSVGVLAVIGLSYAAAVWWMRRRRVELERAVELTMLMIPVMAPLLEFHHFVFSLPTILLQWRRWIEGRMRPGFGVVYFLAWLNLSQSYVYLSIWNDHPMVLNFSPLLSSAVLAVGMVVESWRDKADAAGTNATATTMMAE